eukprot:TRINITY_DN1010_c0_g2_i1.p1 TRINITY_DN1010_c0_g2~~TRINITY_DN1010_c0_g2_i1.p1  ORF type:complete len:620 (+),score=202.42 TRINITY_DN1010_c0_g2_i1:67-1926(+)
MAADKDVLEALKKFGEDLESVKKMVQRGILQQPLETPRISTPNTKARKGGGRHASGSAASSSKRSSTHEGNVWARLAGASALGPERRYGGRRAQLGNACDVSHGSVGEGSASHASSSKANRVVRSGAQRTTSPPTTERSLLAVSGAHARAGREKKKSASPNVQRRNHGVDFSASSQHFDAAARQPTHSHASKMKRSMSAEVKQRHARPHAAPQAHTNGREAERERRAQSESAHASRQGMVVPPPPPSILPTAPPALSPSRSEESGVAHTAAHTTHPMIVTAAEITTTAPATPASDAPAAARPTPPPRLRDTHVSPQKARPEANGDADGAELQRTVSRTSVAPELRNERADRHDSARNGRDPSPTGSDAAAGHTVPNGNATNGSSSPEPLDRVPSTASQATSQTSPMPAAPPKNPHLSKIPKLSLGGVIEKKGTDPSFTYEKFLTLTTGEQDVRACPVVSIPAKPGAATATTTVNLGDSTAPQAQPAAAPADKEPEAAAPQERAAAESAEAPATAAPDTSNPPAASEPAAPRSPPRPVFQPPANMPKNPHLSKIPKLSLGGVIEKKGTDPSFTYEKFLTLTTGEQDVRACPVVSIPAKPGAATATTTVNLGDSTAPQAQP